MDTEATLSLAPSRPAFNRQRSNSLPFTEPLQCTATEAAIMFAAERAVLNRRRAPSAGDANQRRRPLSARDPNRPHPDNIRHSKPKTHSNHRQWDTSSSEESDNSEDVENTPRPRQRQAPRPDPTTIKAATEPAPAAPKSPTLTRSNTSPTAVYSAGLAKFIQGRLVSLSSQPGAQPIPNARSSPNVSQAPRTRSQPNERRSIEREEPQRPPLRSSFSAWSTPGDSSAFEEDDDEVVPLPTTDEKARPNAITNTSTPSILDFYQTSAANSSFLLPDTPAEADDEGEEHRQDDGEESDDQSDTHSMFSDAPSTVKPGPPSRSNSDSTTTTQAEQSRPTPDSFLNVPEKRSPMVREKSYFQVATSPFKTLLAISPYEGQALTRVYDMQVHGSKRIVTEGMAFDLFRELKMPVRHSRVI